MVKCKYPTLVFAGKQRPIVQPLHLNTALALDSADWKEMCQAEPVCTCLLYTALNSPESVEGVYFQTCV